MSEKFKERIALGLQRKCIVTCSGWAENYRVMGAPFPGPWSFKRHPWLKDFHDCNNPNIVIMKNAQGGWSESVLNKSFFNIDAKGLSVLYILPSATPDAKDFSASRFGPALQLSSHIASIFSDVNNVGMKLAGNACLYVRGSRSRGGLKSVPTAIIIQDEYDEHDMSLVSLAEKRSDGQLEDQKQNIKLSTPTIAEFGIHTEYKNSTQDHFFFRCPHCSLMTELIFPESLVITSDSVDDPKLNDTHLICKECKVKLDHETKIDWLADNEWVSGNTLSPVKGYYINQLYSCAISPKVIATRYLKGLHDPFAEQEFYNSTLGLPHATKGARLTSDQVSGCIRSHLMGVPKNNRLTTMGVDVGHDELFVEISEYWKHNGPKINEINADTFCRVIYSEKIMGSGIEGFKKLAKLMNVFRVKMCVIDVEPETRMATEFYNQFPTRVKLCRFTTATSGKTIVPDKKQYIIQVDRTCWLDHALGRFKTNKIILPQNISLEYIEHQTALTKVYRKTNDGNIVSRYDKSNLLDHFSFSRVYNEIALPLALSSGRSSDIRGIL